MKPSRIPRILAALAACAAATAPGALRAQDAHVHHHPDTAAYEPVRLAELQAVALAANPGLLALRALADAATARVPESGTLPDPMLMVGAMNLGLPELDAGMPASMLPSIQLSQTFPFFGKLGLREEMAEADGEAARVAVAEAEWRLRARVAQHFHDLYALDQNLAVHRRTLELLRDFQSVARSLYASGDGRQGDVIRADVEVARMDAEIQRQEATRAARAASLNALLDRPGDQEVGTPVPDSLPAGFPAPDTLLSWAMETRPALEGEAVRLERARKGVELAEKDFWPDFTVSAQYGRRGGDQPRSMGGLMIGASIPVHAGSRQRPRVEAARAMERAAEAGVSGARAAVDAELRGVLAELERARSLMTLYRDEILPAAEANVASSLASYRVGAVDFSTLVDAQLAVDRFEQDYHRLEADYGTAVALLEAAVGRDLPRNEILPSAETPEVP
ncbi:MAG TPA: TolC family protein [Longimicrobiales bacterium]|nr:TolC family protein [Longimicrobiales bacterium]